MYQNLTSNISKTHLLTSSIFMSFLIKLGMRNSKMKWKPELEVVLRTILAKTKFLGFLGLVYGWYVYVRRQRDQPFDRSTGDGLDRRRGPETELLRPGEPTPITLSVVVYWCPWHDEMKRCLVERQTYRLQHALSLAASAERVTHRGNIGRIVNEILQQIYYWLCQ